MVRVVPTAEAWEGLGVRFLFAVSSVWKLTESSFFGASHGFNVKLAPCPVCSGPPAPQVNLSHACDCSLVLHCLQTLDDVVNWRIACDNHCFGCTAGSGSGCGGQK
eukprot:1158876-Pelagomonas_calceolata.AAC.10